jgi:hypothetical protein
MLAFVQRVQDSAPDVPPRVSVSHAKPRDAAANATQRAPAADSLPLTRETLLANANVSREGFYVAAALNAPDDSE